MSSYPPSDGIGQTPPTTPGALPAAPPVWSKVIGIISIVLGALGVVAQGCGIAGVVAMPLMAEPMREAAKQAAAQGGGNAAGAAEMEQQAAMFDAMAQYAPLVIGSGVLNMICAVLLIVAGIQLLKRRVSGRTLHLAYAGLRTVGVLFSLVPGWLMHVAQMEAMQASGVAMPPGLGAGFMTGMGVAGLVLGAVWGLVYPVFIVVWFMRGKIREQVSAWEGEQARFGTV